MLFQQLKSLRQVRLSFRNDKEGNLHLLIGKVSFTNEQLVENFNEVYQQVTKLKPAKAKGVYLQSITICSTMGPGVKVMPMDVKWKGNNDVK